MSRKIESGREPREGTIRATVLMHVREGKSPKEIRELTGFRKSQVKNARGDIFRYGVEEAPTEEERSIFKSKGQRNIEFTEERRINIGNSLRGKKRSIDVRRRESETRGGVLVTIEPFALIGLDSFEIEAVLKLTSDKKISYRQIDDSLRSARKSGALPTSLWEERKPGRKNNEIKKAAATQKMKVLLSDGVQISVEALLERRELTTPNDLAKKIVLAEIFVAYQNDQGAEQYSQQELCERRWEFLPEEYRKELEIQRGVLIRTQEFDAYARLLIMREGSMRDLLGNGEETKSHAIARGFFDAGFFTEDLSSWNLLHKMYVESGRALPDSFVDKLRLEAYLVAIDALGKNDPKVLTQYRKIGDEVDAEWARKSLAPYEAFITMKYFSPWADGEDKRGLYRITPQGRQYIFVSDEDGAMVYDKTRLVVKRSLSRMGQIVSR